MASRNSVTRAKIAIILAMLLLSVSVVSSFTRHIRFSGPPQFISAKYEAFFYGVYDSHIAVISSSIKLDGPSTVCFAVLAVLNEDRTTHSPSLSLYVRPPPLAGNNHYLRRLEHRNKPLNL